MIMQFKCKCWTMFYVSKELEFLSFVVNYNKINHKANLKFVLF